MNALDSSPGRRRMEYDASAVPGVPQRLGGLGGGAGAAGTHTH